MKYYKEIIKYKQKNKIYTDYKYLPTSVEYWKDIIKKSDIKSYLVTANFNYSMETKKIELTYFKLDTMEKNVEYKLVTDLHLIAKLKLKK